MAPKRAVVAAQKALVKSPAEAMSDGDVTPPTVPVGQPGPVKKISGTTLRVLGQELARTFDRYRKDRRFAEVRWLRNQRQYLGLYDPEVLKQFSVERSQAYPRITRIKIISTVARLMNLMFPGNEKNWTLKSSPVPDLTPEDVKAAIDAQLKKDKEAGVEMGGPNGPPIDEDYIERALVEQAAGNARKFERLIDDQLQELGGDQTIDYVTLNKKVTTSGALYGLGLLHGPFARKVTQTRWSMGADGMPVIKKGTAYKPQFEVLRVWDYYPDMTANTLAQQDGYFIRKIVTKSQLRKLADRDDFFSDQIKQVIERHPQGNYKAQPFEQELKAMGVKEVVDDNSTASGTNKFEIRCWYGPVDAQKLLLLGVEIPESKRTDDIDAVVWTVDEIVIKADMNPWTKIGCDVKTVHWFLFDEDDTSPIGTGLPNAVRDSQMAISAFTRMLIDNASVVCGPNLEVNTDLLLPEQDITRVEAYKVWYRDGMGLDAQQPAVKNIQIQSHIPELINAIKLFMDFADAETFVGPATGGDMSKAPSEPMRTVAGASMLRGDAALPFKDLVRNFDVFTTSVIDSIVEFNRQFNKNDVPAGDYNVISRGASSLIAKEVRGAQLDQLAQTLRPEEMIHVDERKFLAARFAARDMDDLLVSEGEAKRRQQAQQQAQAQQDQQQQEMLEANIRKLLSDAYKNISQAGKNSAAADAQSVKAALDVLEAGLTGVGGSTDGGQQAKPGKAGAASANQRSQVIAAPAGNGAVPAAGEPGAEDIGGLLSAAAGAGAGSAPFGFA